MPAPCLSHSSPEPPFLLGNASSPPGPLSVSDCERTAVEGKVCEGDWLNGVICRQVGVVRKVSVQG